MTGNTERLPGLYTGPSAYRSAFEQGLARMLDEPVLGAFILVLGNAGFDSRLHRRFREDLNARFIDWCTGFDRAAPEAVGAAADDVAVFRGLREVGIDALGLTRWRQVGDWWLQFNPLRAFRPPRSSQARVEAQRRPFDPAVFHFDKPFLRPEVVWEGQCMGYVLRLLLNKFPFATGHALLVPEPGAGLPQWLDERWHRLVWELAGRAGRSLPGIGFGYNALGAFASVNHLHFQQFVEPDRPYPIESPQWRHNGGGEAYPMAVMRFDEVEPAWETLDRLQSTGQGFNLLYRPGLLYVARRALQGHYRHSEWTSGFAWSETAGVITVPDERAYRELDAPGVRAEFDRLRLSPAPS